LSQTIEPLRFGSLSVWPPFVAAPMAGYTDSVYREILREFGCPFCYTEMISAKGLVLGGQATLELLDHSPWDRPLAVQLFGSEPDDMFNAAQKIQQYDARFDAVDINMGCPARKITSQGAGGALLKDVSRARQIVQAVKMAAGLPVLVKMRTGWDDCRSAVDFASNLCDAGADMIAVHGRTVSQGYGGKANWAVISQIAGALDIPVVGNGDIVSVQQSIDCLNETGCSGIMIGRGILGNPFFFKQLHKLIQGASIKAPSNAERIETARVHLRRACKRYGEHRAFLELKKHLSLYFKGIRGASKFRESIHRAGCLGEMAGILERFSSQIE